MSITSTDMHTLSCGVSMQILLGELTHVLDSNLAGAHCDGIFVDFLVIAWMGEGMLVGL